MLVSKVTFPKGFTLICAGSLRRFENNKLAIELDFVRGDATSMSTLCDTQPKIDKQIQLAWQHVAKALHLPVKRQRFHIDSPLLSITIRMAYNSAFSMKTVLLQQVEQECDAESK